MRLLLVEDDAMLGDAVAAGLRQNGHAVDWVRDAPASMSALHAVAYDGVVLDLGLPRGSGLDVLRWLRERGQICSVIVATARDRVADRVAGLDAGADDYIVKPFDLDELAARLRAVERRRRDQTQSTIRVGSVVLDTSRRVVSRAEQAVDLTAREYALLEALMLEPGRVVSRSELEDRLYGFGDEIGSNAVEVFVHHLRRKLGDDFVVNVRGRGYRIAAND
ncbi:MAG TPA: response regulator transcription factor, partial [Steroidobacteraceae bacterium]